MKNKTNLILSAFCLLALAPLGNAQYRKAAPQVEPTEAQQLITEASQSEAPIQITLDQAIEIALSENVTVKIADKEIQRNEYAKKGTYAALYPSIDFSGSYQRTLLKNDIRAMMGDSEMTQMMGDKTKIGNTNTFSTGFQAGMPIINSQLWASLKISGLSVETAIEKARGSRLEMLTQVKQAYYAVLLAKEAYNVYKEVYDNAVTNFKQIETKYQAQKASEMDYLRAQTTVSNAVPNLYNASSSIDLALWQLKALMGVDLNMNFDTVGAIDDYAQHMFYDVHSQDSLDLSGNSTLRQLDLQTATLKQSVKAQKLAYAPTVSANIAINWTAVANDPVKKLSWFPYSSTGLQLSIPIFSGFKRLNAVREAKNQYEQIQLTRTDTERQLRIAAENYRITMETNMKSYYSAQDAVKTAQKGYDIVAKSYELGRATLTDINDSQLQVVQARLNQSQSVYNFVVAKSNLEQLISKDLMESQE